jgi:hypothetical protein
MDIKAILLKVILSGLYFLMTILSLYAAVTWWYPLLGFTISFSVMIIAVWFMRIETL